MLILGTNFLSRFKRIELNWARAEIKLKEIALPCTGMTYNPPEIRDLITLDVRTVLPAKSIVRVPVTVINLYKNVPTVKFDPYQRSAQNVYLAAAVTDVVDSKIPVQTFNAHLN